MRKTKTKGQSPYVKYSKFPYQYQFKTCGHKTTAMRSATGSDRDGKTIHWHGHVCTVCNTIRA